jgi:hypothetical protein
VDLPRLKILIKKAVLREYGGQTGINEAIDKFEAKNRLSYKLLIVSIIGICASFALTFSDISTAEQPPTTPTEQVQEDSSSQTFGGIITSDEQNDEVINSITKIFDGNALSDKVGDYAVQFLKPAPEEEAKLRKDIKEIFLKAEKMFSKSSITAILWKFGLGIFGSMLILALVWKVVVINATLGFLRFFVEHNGKKQASQNLKFLPQMDLTNIGLLLKRLKSMALLKDARHQAYKEALQSYKRLEKYMKNDDSDNMKKFVASNKIIIESFMNRFRKELDNHKVLLTVLLTKIGRMENELSQLESELSALEVKKFISTDTKEISSLKKEIKPLSKRANKLRDLLAEGGLASWATKFWSLFAGLQRSKFMLLIPVAYFANEISNYYGWTTWDAGWTWPMLLTMLSMLAIYVSGLQSDKLYFLNLYKAPKLFEIYKIAVESGNEEAILKAEEGLFSLHTRQLLRYVLEEERELVPSYNMAQMSISTIEMFLIQEGLEDGIVSHKDSMYDEHRKNGIILQNIADSVANN